MCMKMSFKWIGANSESSLLCQPVQTITVLVLAPLQEPRKERLREGGEDLTVHVIVSVASNSFEV